jgi:hypothetical protein
VFLRDFWLPNSFRQGLPSRQFRLIRRLPTIAPENVVEPDFYSYDIGLQLAANLKENAKAGGNTLHDH